MSKKFATLDEQLCFALYSASSKLTSIYRPILKSLGLTYTQFIVMMALWEKDQISITELARKTGLSKATMTPLLRNLEAKSLITTNRVDSNERQKLITVSESGWQLAPESVKATEAAFCSTGLTTDEAQKIIAMCRKINSI